jgi:hypothetical protein
MAAMGRAEVPSGARRPWPRQAVFAAWIGALVSSGAAAIALVDQLDRIERDFEPIADSARTAIEARVEQSGRTVESLDALWMSSQSVEREEFERFAQRALEGDKCGRELHFYEDADGRANLSPGYAHFRGETPIQRVLDDSTTGRLAQLLEVARSAGKVVLAPDPLSAPSDRPSIAFAIAVGHPRGAPVADPTPVATPAGFVLGRFDVSEHLEEALRSAPRNDLSVEVLSPS